MTVRKSIPGELLRVGLLVLDFILMMWGAWIILDLMTPPASWLEEGCDSSVLLILWMY